MQWKDMYPQIIQPSFEAMADYIGGDFGTEPFPDKIPKSVHEKLPSELSGKNRYLRDGMVLRKSAKEI